ncbi:MAG: D-Ala-D-Ala carboxypeptidase family metallohydrolase [Rhodospirillaceae bacterium]
MTKLSDHFTLAEACKSQIAVRKGIKNTPPATAIPRLVRVATQILEPVRAQFRRPFSPSSWYRSPVLNAAVGSKPTSHHVYGLIPDFEDLKGGVTLTVQSWTYPGSPRADYGPYGITQNTGKIDVRAQGRDLAVLLEGSAAPAFMRLGTLRADIRQTHAKR